MRGNLELVNNLCIKGWCVEEGVSIPEVVILVNGEFFRKVSCHIRRLDVIKATNVDNVFNAFYVDVNLKKGDVVSCVTSKGNTELTRSPRKVLTEIVEGNEFGISQIEKLYEGCRLIKNEKIDTINERSKGTIPFHIYEIENAYINHEGIIYVNGMVVRETLSLFHSRDNTSRRSEQKVASVYSEISNYDYATSIASFGVHNYYHFIFDFLFRYIAYKEFEFTGKFLHTNLQSDFQSKILKVFNVEGGECLNAGVLRYYKKLYYIKPIRNMFVYNKYFMDLFLSKARSFRFDHSFNLKKIYLSRLGNPNRSLENEKDVIDFLRSKGFDIISPETFSIEEQISMFSDVDFVIAPSGAALTNMIFNKSPDKVKVIEICPDSIKFDGSNMNEFWSSFMSCLNVNHKRIYSESLSKCDENIHKQKYFLNLEDLNTSIKEMEGM
ncbi:glycosyltransferase family 61 protein [Alteromonas sp. CNT1-28]|uniref:glycosyltransferase family 61 protein n=1 Tax=Alteromonas sp. CNT1-28 TaxID=2917730 RepID=UPI001EF38D9F|nr:glycosyltransferase family 61 protein [Alteromonas sp. CNT1-28]